jgi:hypothetical protein
MPRESSTTREVRRQYEQVKRLCRKVGAKAAGKPARSQAQRDYAEVKGEYHRLGRKLGKLTKKRARS